MMCQHVPDDSNVSDRAGDTDVELVLVLTVTMPVNQFRKFQHGWSPSQEMVVFPVSCA